MAVGRPPTSVIGRYSIEPAAALVTVGVTWTARWRGSTTPVTPAHSAERRSAPRLPGSVTPSTTSRNGCTPWRDADQQVVELDLGQRRRPGEHALRRLGAGGRRELGPAHIAHRHADALGQLGDVVEHQRVVLVAGHPDLADLAGAGQQQLTHRLAALDLVAAEALRARWPTWTASGWRPTRRPRPAAGSVGLAHRRRRMTGLAAGDGLLGRGRPPGRARGLGRRTPARGGLRPRPTRGLGRSRRGWGPAWAIAAALTTPPPTPTA